MEITTRLPDLQIVGLTGHAGVGKDWIAENILARQAFWPIALADASTAAEPEIRCMSLERWLRIWWTRWGIQRFVVVDIRSLSELSWIHRLGGKVLAVKGDRAPSLILQQRARQPEIARLVEFADACCWNELGAPFEAIEAQVESVIRRWQASWRLAVA